MVWKPHVTVAAVIERDGRFLLVEEEADGAVVLNQPAGHLDDGESLAEAAARETLEETGWPFRPTGVVGVYRWRAPETGRTYLRVAFCGELDDSAPRGPLDAGIRRTLWVEPAALRTAPASGLAPPRSPMVLRGVEDYLAGRRWPLDLLVDLPP